MDLLDEEAAQAFKDAIRDVTDTFHKYPVILEREGGDKELLAGLKVITGELKAREGGEEISEGYEVKFNREYLAEKGLVNEDGKLLIAYDDTVKIDGKRYHIIKSKDQAIFRETKLMVVIEAGR